MSAIDPTKLSPADLARLLSKAGGEPVAARSIEEDVARGAPTNRDGTLHLIHYAAWLAGQVA